MRRFFRYVVFAYCMAAFAFVWVALAIATIFFWIAETIRRSIPPPNGD